MQTGNVKMLAWLAIVLFIFSACTKNKVKCTGTAEKTFTATGFNKIKVSDNFHVSVTSGTTFLVKAKGCTENVNDLVVATNNGGLLTIQYSTTNHVHNETLDIIITMPELIILQADGVSKVSVVGFQQQSFYLRTELAGASEVNITGVPYELTFSLSGTSKLNASGTTDGLYGQLNGASSLSAYGLVSRHTDINASGAAKASVTAQDKLMIEASGASVVRYKGNPLQIYTETSGTAKIIKE